MDNEGNGFNGWNVAFMVGSFFLGNLVGQKRTLQAIEDQKRDQEILELKKQLAYLNSKVTKQIE